MGEEGMMELGILAVEPSRKLPQLVTWLVMRGPVVVVAQRIKDGGGGHYFETYEPGPARHLPSIPRKIVDVLDDLDTGRSSTPR